MAGNLKIWVLGEALMDCIAQPDGTLRPLQGGSPFNMARAAALRGADTGYLNPLSTDQFGQGLQARLHSDGVQVLSPTSSRPTSLAVVQIAADGQPSYGFYRDGIADRDYDIDHICQRLRQDGPGILHTGSLMLLPPEHERTLQVIQAARDAGWIISLDANLRPKLARNLDEYIQAVHAGLRLADWIKVSDEDLELLGFHSPRREHASAIAQHFTDQGASRVAVTFGGDGAYLVVDGAAAESDVPSVSVVDTVGAGDTFWGNCVADWGIHPTANEDHAAPAARVATTLRNAMIAAAINCTRRGCQPPRWSEVQAFTAPGTASSAAR